MQENFETKSEEFTEEAKKIFEELYAQKLMMLYRTKINITPKEVSYDEFLKGGE